MTHLERDLRRLLPTECVSTDPKVLQAHSGDKWFASNVPEALVAPRTAEEVSVALNYASQHGIPITARGAGYGYVGGCVPVRGGIVLSLARMNRILEINRRDFVAVVQPGVTTGHLTRQAALKNLLYAPDPASLNESSIGGNIATNAGGPRCLKYGVTKHWVLGLQVVLADGSIVRTGGRTHKNKTGFDLTSLFVGSEGLLGVVTEATLKLLPLPPLRSALSAIFPTVPKAARAVDAIFAGGHLPAAIEIADAFTLNAARARLGQKILPPGNSHLLVEIDGQEAAVKGELKALRRLLQELGASAIRVAVGNVETNVLWGIRREFSESLKATGLTKLNEDVVVPRGRLVDLIKFAASLQRKYQTPVACFGHAGDGNIHVNVMVNGYDQLAVRERMDRALDELFKQVLAWGGTITGEHGIGLAKLPWWNVATSQVLRGMHESIKAALDPTGILNPGKFVEAPSRRGGSRAREVL